MRIMARRAGRWTGVGTDMARAAAGNQAQDLHGTISASVDAIRTGALVSPRVAFAAPTPVKIVYFIQAAEYESRGKPP